MSLLLHIDIHDDWIPIVHRQCMVQDAKLQRLLENLRRQCNALDISGSDSDEDGPLYLNLRLARWHFTFRPPEASVRDALEANGVVLKMKVYENRKRIDLLIDFDLAQEGRNLIEGLEQELRDVINARKSKSKSTWVHLAIASLEKSILSCLVVLCAEWTTISFSMDEVDELRTHYLKSGSPFSGVFPTHFRDGTISPRRAIHGAVIDTNSNVGGGWEPLKDYEQVPSASGSLVSDMEHTVNGLLKLVGSGCLIKETRANISGIIVFAARRENGKSGEQFNCVISGDVPFLAIRCDDCSSIVECLAVYCICQAHWAYCEGLGSSVWPNTGFYDLGAKERVSYDVWSDRVRLFKSAKRISNIVLNHSAEIQNEKVIQDLKFIGLI